MDVYGDGDDEIGDTLSNKTEIIRRTEMRNILEARYIDDEVLGELLHVGALKGIALVTTRWALESLDYLYREEMAIYNSKCLSLSFSI